MTRFACVFLASLCAAQDLRLGGAAVEITPAAGTPMAGYYNTRLMTGVHDPLFAKAIVLAAGDVRVALVACDLIGLAPQVIEEARRQIQQRTGIPGSHVMISATHSHTGPVITGRSTRDGAYGGSLEITKQYMAALPGKIAQSVHNANSTLVPARAWSGTGKEDSIPFNRRFFMKDGTVGWNPGKLNPNIVKVAGPIDPAVPVVYFDTPQADPLATYVNFAMHLDTVGGLDASADYPATLSRLLQQVKGKDMLTLFTIGTAGNINHIDVSTKRPQKGHAEAQRLGTILAGEVIKTYARLEPAQGPLRARSETVMLDLPRVTPEDVAHAKEIAAQAGTANPPKFLDTVRAFKVLDVQARDGRALEAEVQVISLGDQIAWVALPGEVFVELGMAIKEASPFRQTIVVELAHGPVTYLPSRNAFPQGNYEVVSSRAAEGSGEKLVAAAIRLLKQLHREAR